MTLRSRPTSFALAQPFTLHARRQRIARSGDDFAALMRVLDSPRDVDGVAHGALCVRAVDELVVEGCKALVLQVLKDCEKSMPGFSAFSVSLGTEGTVG